MCSPCHTILLGGFNYSDIYLSTLSGACQNTDKFCDFISKCNLSQFVDPPTHIRGNTLRSCCVSVDPDSNSIISSDQPLSFHSIWYVSGISIQKNEPVFVYDYSQADLEGLCFFSLLDADIWSFISETVLNAIDLFTPKVKLRCNQRPKWMSSELKHKKNSLQSYGENVRNIFLCPTKRNYATSNLPCKHNT